MNADRALIGIRGHLIDTPRMGELRSRRDGALIIDSGLIAEVGDYETLKRKPRKQEVRWLHSRQVAVFPGLIDLHTHLPQYPVVAKGHMQLLPWLREYIFPLERDFNAERAAKEAPAFFHELARHGTTTAMIYSSASEESTEIAFQAAEKSGLRVIMGAMMMDFHSFGDVLPLKQAAASLAESERLCKKWNCASGGRIHYAFSPRFAICCSEELMRGAAHLAREHGAYIQTHLAENLEEIANVRHLFPEAKDYTDVYHKSGLLTPFTVLGHCVHLSKREIAVLAETGAAVAHCPSANFFLNSGIMPLDRILTPGIKMGHRQRRGRWVRSWTCGVSCARPSRRRRRARFSSRACVRAAAIRGALFRDARRSRGAPHGRTHRHA